MNYKLICLECKNEIDLANYKEKLEEFKKDDTVRVIIECNHCATDHLVKKIEEDGTVKAEVIEMEK